MSVKFTKTFDSYHAATLWCHEREFSPVMTEKAGKWIVTLEGDEAIRAIEEASNAKVIQSEAA